MLRQELLFGSLRSSKVRYEGSEGGDVAISKNDACVNQACFLDEKCGEMTSNIS